MTANRSIQLVALAAVAVGLVASPTYAVSVSPFGQNGEGGFVNDQTFTVGSGGDVFEIDAFLNIAGQDLNGAVLGSSAQLSVDPVPSGLDFAFSAAVTVDTTDITLSYDFVNNTAGMTTGSSTWI